MLSGNIYVRVIENEHFVLITLCYATAWVGNPYKMYPRGIYIASYQTYWPRYTEPQELLLPTKLEIAAVGTVMVFFLSYMSSFWLLFSDVQKLQ